MKAITNMMLTQQTKNPISQFTSWSFGVFLSTVHRIFITLFINRIPWASLESWPKWIPVLLLIK